MRRHRAAIVVGGLVGLLLLAQVQHALAVVGKVWWSIPSWDGVATHDFETSASITPLYTDPARQLREHAAALADHRSRALLPDSSRAPVLHPHAHRITRAPPLTVPLDLDVARAA